MGPALGYRPGGIVGLLGQPRETWDALEADLLAHGLTLDDYPKRLSLCAIRSYMFWADPDSSALARLQRGPKAGWRHVEELLASILEILMEANWQRAGKKTTPHPKPITRPGDEPEGVQHFGTPVSIAELDRRLAERMAA